MDPDGSPWVTFRVALGKEGGRWDPAESRPQGSPASTAAPPHVGPAPTAAPPPRQPRPHGTILRTRTLQSA